jgi:hypothetical protein
LIGIAEVAVMAQSHNNATIVMRIGQRIVRVGDVDGPQFEFYWSRTEPVFLLEE